jgi:hypothetical protein
MSFDGRWRALGLHAPWKRKISVTQVVRDIRSGASEQELREKYKIAPHRVAKLFKRIVATGVVGESELAERFPAHKAAIFSIYQDRERRAVLAVQLIAYDITSSTIALVRDISETGLRVAGIDCSVDEERTFQVPMEPVMQVDPLLIVAKCKWVKARGKIMKYSTAGFEITALSERDGLVLKTLVQSLSIHKSSGLRNRAQVKGTGHRSVTVAQDGTRYGRVPSSGAIARQAASWPPSWFDEEAIKGLQEIYRSGTLQEIIAWWKAQKWR